MVARFELMRNIYSRTTPAESSEKTVEQLPPIENSFLKGHDRLLKKKPRNKELIQFEDNTLFEVPTRIRDQSFEP